MATFNTIAMVVGYIVIYGGIVLLITSWLFGRATERLPKAQREQFYKGKNYNHLNK